MTKKESGPPPILSPTILELLRLSEGYLHENEIENAGFDARELVARACSCTRMDLYLDFDRRPEEPVLAELRHFLKRRKDGEPLQYILGNQPFRQAEIHVDGRVLIPRPETEELVGLVLEGEARAQKNAHKEKTGAPSGLRDESSIYILDAGTGSGCIAIALALEHPTAKLDAVDTSPDALDLARENAVANKVSEQISFIRCNLLEWLPQEGYDVLVSNPPYVRDTEKSSLAVELAWEPEQALFGTDEDGLGFYRRFADHLGDFLKPGGRFYFEIGAEQGEALMNLFAHRAVNLAVLPDLAGRDRFLLGQRALTS